MKRKSYSVYCPYSDPIVGGTYHWHTIFFLTFSGEIHCVLLSHWRINYYFWKKYTLDPLYERFENSQFWCHFLSISNLLQNTSHKLYLQHIHMICDLNMSTLIADVPGLLEYCHLLKMLISFFKNNGSWLSNCFDSLHMFQTRFFLSGFTKNSQVQSVTTRPPPNGRALARHRFPQRPVTDFRL